MEIAWGIVGVVAALLVGVGVSMVGLSPPEYLVARICFCLSAVVLGGTCMVWELRTQEPIWWRITAGVLVWICVGVGLPESLRWVGGRQASSLLPKVIETPRKLKVTSLVFDHPLLVPGHPIAVRVNFKNISGKSIKMRNATYTQTRVLPKDLAAEKEAEDALWQELVDGLEKQGRDAVIPMVEDEEMNQILESGVLTLNEYMDIMRGSHAVYFASIIRDRETNEDLLELCFFVGRAGIIQYCSQHNGP
jgi:hypothetical protein